MSYEVVARRWRPLTFASVVGQDHVTQTLANAILRDRIPHAFLLTGTRGVGKTTIARLLARAINCTNRSGTAEPCNDCPSCKQSLAGSSMDIIEIDGASNNSVDEVRDLIESAQYRPSAGRFKVFIIDEVHMLTKSAFNALLKTLEEPPSHVKFIMATTEVHKLPATVLSRCQRYDFRRLSDDEIGKQLAAIAEKDGMPIDADAMGLLAREAAGSMRDAQSLLEQVMAGADGPLGAARVAQLLGVAGADLISGMVDSIIAGDAGRIVDAVSEVKRFGYDLERLLGEVLEVLRHLTVATVAGMDALPPSVPQAHRAVAERLRGKRSPLDLQRIFAALLGTASDLRRGAHPDLVLEMGLLKVACFEPVETATALLTRLGVMEVKGGTFTAPPRAAAAPASRPAPPSAPAPRPASAAASHSTPASQPSAPKPALERLPLAGKPNPAAVEAWTGVEGEPLIPLSEEEAAARRWEAFLDDVQKRYGLDLFVTITNCKRLSVTPEFLDIVPISAAFAQKLKNPTVLARVTEVARSHYGETTTVRVIDSASAPVEGITLQGIHDERTARKKASALADPFVDKAVAGLGGRVTKISVLDE